MDKKYDYLIVGAGLFGSTFAYEAKKKIEEQKLQASVKEPKNLEEQAISMVGTDIYKKLIKGYT